MTADHSTRALSFGAQAATYDATRPSYPEALLERLASWSPEVVADVGAGTGKLTRLLAARGWQVTAVEPDSGMRTVLEASAPDVMVVAGRGESIPLPSGSLDLLTYAQAWHWVDEPAAVAEAARVLRSGGVLALIWNTRDNGDSWIAEVETLTRSGAKRADLEGQAHVLSGFTAMPPAAFPWRETLARADLMRRARTWSSVATLPERERATLLGRLDELLSSHPETVGVDPLELPHVTLLFAYRRD